MTNVQLCKKVCRFSRISTVRCHLPVKRFAGDSRAKGQLSNHKKALARDSTISLRAAAIVRFHAKRMTARPKEQHQYEPTTQSRSNFTGRGYFCAYNRSLSGSTSEAELVGHCISSPLSRQVSYVRSPSDCRFHLLSFDSHICDHHHSGQTKGNRIICSYPFPLLIVVDPWEVDPVTDPAQQHIACSLALSYSLQTFVARARRPRRELAGHGPVAGMKRKRLFR
jgi:hypothetical protein